MQTDVVRARGSTTELQDTMGKFTLINSIFNETEEKVVSLIHIIGHSEKA